MTVSARVLASAVDQQKAAPLGLFVLILLGVACYFLFKSMSGHLRRVRDDFPPGGYAPNDGGVGGQDATPNDSSRPVVISPDDGLTRPAPVTLTRSRASEPRLIRPGPPEPRTTEPRAIEPRVIEPGVIEPGVIEPGVIEPGVTEPGVIEPRVVENSVIEPGVTEPRVVEHGVIEHGVVENSVIDPGRPDPS